ncbi:unnamed protein product [Amoebophrya sp. A120]|nr:unnamed protein product [Amoebophrya sp. A120]|eukprot:GSA120T00023979001.1
MLVTLRAREHFLLGCTEYQHELVNLICVVLQVLGAVFFLKNQHEQEDQYTASLPSETTTRNEMKQQEPTHFIFHSGSVLPFAAGGSSEQHDAAFARRLESATTRTSVNSGLQQHHEVIAKITTAPSLSHQFDLLQLDFTNFGEVLLAFGIFVLGCNVLIFGFSEALRAHLALRGNPTLIQESGGRGQRELPESALHVVGVLLFLCGVTAHFWVNKTEPSAGVELALLSPTTCSLLLAGCSALLASAFMNALSVAWVGAAGRLGLDDQLAVLILALKALSFHCFAVYLAALSSTPTSTSTTTPATYPIVLFTGMLCLAAAKGFLLFLTTLKHRELRIRRTVRDSLLAAGTPVTPAMTPTDLTPGNTPLPQRA